MPGKHNILGELVHIYNLLYLLILFSAVSVEDIGFDNWKTGLVIDNEEINPQ